jgi:hypothetical protein
MDSLEELGEPTMEAVLRHLKETHVSLAPEDLDMDQVAIELRKVFGDGAEVLMRNVSRHYATMIMLGTSNKDIKRLTPLDKIQRFVRVNG